MMFKTLRDVLHKLGNDEGGQALILILIFLFIGSLLILPLLGFTTSGLKTGGVYEKKTDELYAADAGVQDARWQIKYDYLDTTFINQSYSQYAFNTPWAYSLSDNVNAKHIDVTIENLWMPKYISLPGVADARAIVEAEKLIVTSGNGTSSYNINVTYYPESGDVLSVETLGIWLPRGYAYTAGSSNLESLADDITVEPHAGGQAVLWTFNPPVLFDSFPGVNPVVSPRTTEVTFRFTSTQLSAPDAVAWIITSGVTDIPFSWDADARVYKVTSKAASTTVEAYMVKKEPRLLRSGLAGDYKAAGNSLMRDANNDGLYRETLDSESSAIINSIPSDATVRAAYLYWSAWRSQVIFSDTSQNFTNWNNGAAWSMSSGSFRGRYSSGGEAAKYLTLKTSLDLSAYAPGTVKVIWNQDEDGTLEIGDKLYFAFSSDNGTTWGSNIMAFQDDNPPGSFTYTIPSAFLTNNVRIRFYLSEFTDSGEYAYLDNITVSTTAMVPDTSVNFKIDGNQVSFSANGTPQQGAAELIADTSQMVINYIGSDPSGFSYVCFKDVTALVKAFSAKAPDPAANHPGNANYAVGGVAGDPAIHGVTKYQLAYAGWSIVIIYSSVETVGHQIYLYDTFIHSDGGMNVDFDSDGQPGGTISGFIVPEPITGEVDAANLTVFVGEGDVSYTGDYLAFQGTRLWDSTNTTQNSVSNPNNVWNSKSLGMSADGVDIDTFHVTWASGLLQPGATSAQIDVPTTSDEWNLIYIILSFRSRPRAGGTLSYLIEG